MAIVGALKHGLAVLDLLKNTPEPLGVREVGRRLDLTPPTVQRLLNTLAAHGYVEQESISRRYRIGYAVLGLAQHVYQRGKALPLAEAELRRMAVGGCLNGFLGVRRGSSGVYVLAVQSESPVVIKAHPGQAMPLHSTALGKALLLGMSDGEIADLLGQGPLERFTERTITRLDHLTEQLKSARLLGYATVISENIADVISVGAPIYNANGALIAAISVAFPRAVYPKAKIADVGEEVLLAAVRISQGLGFAEKITTEEKGDIPE